MVKTLQKRFIKPDDNNESNKYKFVLIIVSLIVFIIIIIAVINSLDRPKTFEELEPMMEEAILFDQKASDMAGGFDSIEDQIGEERYFGTVEQGFEDSVITQENVIETLRETDLAIQEAGGITTYNDLQGLQKPVTDPMAAKEVADQFGIDNSNLSN